MLQSLQNEQMKRITIARGDGIGPEIMGATLSILKAAQARIEIDEIEIGEKVYLSGESSGISRDSWDSIRNNKVFLKGPDHDTTRRWIQESECYDEEVPGTFRQCKTML